MGFSEDDAWVCGSQSSHSRGVLVVQLDAAQTDTGDLPAGLAEADGRVARRDLRQHAEDGAGRIRRTTRCVAGSAPLALQEFHELLALALRKRPLLHECAHGDSASGPDTSIRNDAAQSSRDALFRHRVEVLLQDPCEVGVHARIAPPLVGFPETPGSRRSSDTWKRNVDTVTIGTVDAVLLEHVASPGCSSTAARLRQRV